jgi:hypothetical protein
MNVRSNVPLILSTSPIDNDRIIRLIENLIDQSVLLKSIKHHIKPIALVWLIMIEFDRLDLTQWRFDPSVVVWSVMIE